MELINMGSIDKNTVINTSIGVMIAVLLFGVWIATYVAGYDKRLTIVEVKQSQMENDISEIKKDTKQIIDILISNQR